jgi:hypothetical protein
MGYSDGTKGYRLYKLEKKKLVVSRGAIFDEKEVYSQVFTGRRVWYSQIDKYFLQNEFEKSKSEPTL